MKMIVRAFVFGPEKGGWREEKENLPTAAHTGYMKSARAAHTKYKERIEKVQTLYHILPKKFAVPGGEKHGRAHHTAL